MRTRDEISRPVITVAPDAHLKDVAATLVEHGINAVPVVEEGDRLVGIGPRQISSRWRPRSPLGLDRARWRLGRARRTPLAR